MLAEHGYARFATVCDTYVDSTFSSRTMIDSRLDTLSTDRNWSICEKFQIYKYTTDLLNRFREIDFLTFDFKFRVSWCSQQSLREVITVE